MARKSTSNRAVKKTAHAGKRQTVGESIIQGLKEAIAWTKGENDKARVTLVRVGMEQKPEEMKCIFRLASSSSPRSALKT